MKQNKQAQARSALLLAFLRALPWLVRLALAVLAILWPDAAR
jgi:hypothetical protein